MHNNDFVDTYFGFYCLLSFGKYSTYAGNEWTFSMDAKFYIVSSNKLINYVVWVFNIFNCFCLLDNS